MSGVMLYCALAAVSRAAVLRTLKNTVTVCPVRTAISGVSGSNFQGRPGATLASKRTFRVRAPRAAGAAVATCGVPP